MTERAVKALLLLSLKGLASIPLMPVLFLKSIIVALALITLQTSVAQSQYAVPDMIAARYYLDAQGLLSAEQVLALPETAFKSPGQNVINLGVRPYQATNLWIRITLPDLRNDNASTMVLSLAEPTLLNADIHLTTPAADAAPLIWKRGVDLGAAGLPTQRFPIFSIPAPWLDGRDILLRVQANSRLHVPISLDRPAQFLSNYTRETLLFGILFGVMFILSIYSTALGRAVDEKALEALGILSFAFLIQVVIVKGFHYHLFPASTYRAIYPIADLAAKIAQFMLPLMGAFFVFGDRLPSLLSLAFKIIGGLFVGAFVLDMILIYGLNLPSLRPYAALFTGLSAVLILSVVLTAVMGRPRKDALLFLLCWAPLMVFALSRATTDFGSEKAGQQNVLLMNGIYIAFVLSVASFAILVSLRARIRSQGQRRDLADSEKRFRDYAEAASDGYFATDEQRRIVTVLGNSALQRLFQNLSMKTATLDDLLMRSRSSATHANLAADLKQGEAFRGLVVELRDDQPAGHVLMLSGRPQHNDQGQFTGYRGVISDITRQSAQEQQLAHQRSLASLGLLMGSIAHEINNALHPILNLSRKMTELLTKDSREAHFASVVQDCAGHAHRIVSRVLDYAKDRDADEKVTVGDALESAVSHLRSFIATHEIIFTPNGQSQRLVGRTEMFQVVSNLVANAQSASPEGGSIVIRSYDDKETQQFVLEVMDEGTGLTPKEIDRLNQNQLSDDLPSSHDTGLGLKIVRVIVENWLGTMTFVSSQETGTVVRITMAKA